MAFVRVTSMELDHGVADPRWLRAFAARAEPAARCDLGTAWAALQFLLDAAAVPVDLRVDGDPLDDEQTLAAWYPDLVADAAAALRAAEPDALLRRHDPLRMREVGIAPATPAALRPLLTALDRFFTGTADRGAGALMTLT